MHSRVANKRAVLDAIRRGEHRIVVCVDMFGEGFDLPNLKIAALHSVHKSLRVTLQFIGRLARTGSHVGDATFIANTAEDGVPEDLESLDHEDSDWNLLLADLILADLSPMRSIRKQSFRSSSGTWSLPLLLMKLQIKLRQKLPSGRVPTTHILKPPSGEFAGHAAIGL